MHDIKPVVSLETVVGAVAALDAENVVARSARQHVRTGAADDEIVAAAAGDGVVAGAAFDAGDIDEFGRRKIQGVVVLGAGNDVDASAAVDSLHRVDAVEDVHAEGVVAVAALHDIKPVVSLETVVGAVAALDAENVVARSARQHVRTGAADDEIVAAAAGDGVVAGAAFDAGDIDEFGRRKIQGVVVLGAGNDVDASAAVDSLHRVDAVEDVHAEGVVAVAALHDIKPVVSLETVVGAVAALDAENVVARSARQHVRTGAADDEVVARSTADGVVTGAAFDKVGGIAARQGVVVFRAGDPVRRFGIGISSGLQHGNVPHRTVGELNLFHPLGCVIEPALHRDLVRGAADFEIQVGIVPRERDIRHRYPGGQAEGVDVAFRGVVFDDRVLPTTPAKQVNVVPRAALQGIVARPAVDAVRHVGALHGVVAATAIQIKPARYQFLRRQHGAVGEHETLDAAGVGDVVVIDAFDVDDVAVAQVKPQRSLEQGHLRRVEARPEEQGVGFSAAEVIDDDVVAIAYVENVGVVARAAQQRVIVGPADQNVVIFPAK